MSFPGWLVLKDKNKIFSYQPGRCVPEVIDTVATRT